MFLSILRVGAIVENGHVLNNRVGRSSYLVNAIWHDARALDHRLDSELPEPDIGSMNVLHANMRFWQLALPTGSVTMRRSVPVDHKKIVLNSDNDLGWNVATRWRKTMTQ